MLPVLTKFYKRFILGKPRHVLTFILVLCVCTAYFSRDFELDASTDSLLLEGDEDLRIFREVSERFGTQDFLFVTFEPDADLFSDISLEQIKSLREELSKLPLVDSCSPYQDPSET